MKKPNSKDINNTIDIQDLKKKYKNDLVLRGITMQISKGEMFALLGPNGSGKSTLFSILSTLQRQTSGSVKVAGFDIIREPKEVRRNIGIVFQKGALAWELSVLDNLKFTARFYGLRGKELNRRVNEVIESMHLENIAAKTARHLSGGQKRAIELARALIPNPKVLFLDEATIGLDLQSRSIFWQEVKRLAHQGTTVLYTTHHMEEADSADRVAFINDGNIVATGSPDSFTKTLNKSVINLQTEDDIRAQAWLEQNDYHSEITGNGLRITSGQPEKLISRLVNELPLPVKKFETTKPTLDDAFMKITGNSLTV